VSRSTAGLVDKSAISAWNKAKSIFEILLRCLLAGLTSYSDLNLTLQSFMSPRGYLLNVNPIFMKYCFVSNTATNEVPPTTIG